MAILVPPALIAPRWRQAFTAAAIAPNLLCGVLGVAPQPFSNGDSSLPAPRPYPVSLRTWIGQPNLGLIGKDQFFGAPGQAPQVDQQLPRSAPRLAQSWTQSLLQSTLAPAVGAVPFVPADWPVPRGTVYAASLRTWAPGVPINLLGQDTMFGGPGQPLANFDWQLPRTVRRALGEGQAPPLALATVIVSIPFSQLDWPLPQASARLDRSWSTSLVLTTLSQPIGARSPDGPTAGARRVLGEAPGIPLTLLAAASTPFGPADSRLPAAASRSGQAWSQNLLLSTLAPSAASRPLSVYDSRLPPAIARGAQTWIGRNFVLGGAVTPPLNFCTPAREIIALESGRLIISINGMRLNVAKSVKRLIS